MSAQRFEIVDLIADNGMDWGVRCDSDLVAQFRNRDDAELFIRAVANGQPAPAGGEQHMTAWRVLADDGSGEVVITPATVIPAPRVGGEKP